MLMNLVSTRAPLCDADRGAATGGEWRGSRDVVVPSHVVRLSESDQCLNEFGECTCPFLSLSDADGVAATHGELNDQLPPLM